MDVVLGKLGPAKPVNTILLPQCWCAFCLIPVSARFAFNSTYVTITHAMGSTWAVPKTFGFVDQDGGAVEFVVKRNTPGHISYTVYQLSTATNGSWQFCHCSLEENTRLCTLLEKPTTQENPTRPCPSDRTNKIV